MTLEFSVKLGIISLVVGSTALGVVAFQTRKETILEINSIKVPENLIQ